MATVSASRKPGRDSSIGLVLIGIVSDQGSRFGGGSASFFIVDPSRRRRRSMVEAEMFKGPQRPLKERSED